MSGQLPISIALPVYNGAAYLREAIDSICAQSFQNFEVVISDNASTDETPRICHEYARRDPRIKVYRTEQFLQQAGNVNRAVDLCSAEWVKLFCHDDLMVPECILSIYRAIESAPSSVGLIANGESWLFMNGHVARIPPSQPPYHRNGPKLLREYLAGNRDVYLPALTPATIRKVAWERAGKFDRRFVHFDVFCWMKLLLEWDYLFISRALTLCRIHGGQVAVSAQKTLRSIHDHRLFFAEFAAQYGDQLQLNWMIRKRLQLRFLGSAGAAVAVKALRNEFGSSIRLFLTMPVGWWPLLPAFALRSYLTEKRRIRSIADHVPATMIFPQ
jgi:glycosyltransferase involved in cell wall biosynthesis